MAENLNKILFRLEQDEDGYPPVNVEGIWCQATGENIFQVDNIPFFVTGIAMGDVIKAKKIGEEWWFVETLKYSGHSTIQIIAYNEEELSILKQTLLNLGCSWEGSHLPKLISVDIPPKVSYRPIRDSLDYGEKKEFWTYCEAAIGHSET